MKKTSIFLAALLALSALRDIVKALAEVENLKEALQVVARLPGESDQSIALQYIAEAQ